MKAVNPIFFYGCQEGYNWSKPGVPTVDWSTREGKVSFKGYQQDYSAIPNESQLIYEI